MTTLTTISVKLPKSDLQRIPASSRSAFIREAVREKLSRQEKRGPPQTAFGKKLMAMRAAYVARGGQLLTPEEIAEEIRERRGGLA
jgi:metal-responsive CopG/Arc/MetJ family transcriptional regulator